MGYSIRTRNWRYTAWLELDTNSFLPSLHLPPLAEELYDHRQAHFEINAARASGLALGDAYNTSGARNLGLMETINVAYDNEFSIFRSQLRVKLYDFLWHNSSFEHLHQKRLDPLARNANLLPITLGRSHPGPHPHHLLHPSGHHYAHLSTLPKIGMQAHAENASLPSVRTVSDGGEEFASLSGFRSTRYVPAAAPDKPSIIVRETGRKTGRSQRGVHSSGSVAQAPMQAVGGSVGMPAMGVQTVGVSAVGLGAEVRNPVVKGKVKGVPRGRQKIKAEKRNQGD